jgi:hypothetical protein
MNDLLGGILPVLSLGRKSSASGNNTLFNRKKAGLLNYLTIRLTLLIRPQFIVDIVLKKKNSLSSIRA